MARTYRSVGDQTVTSTPFDTALSFMSATTIRPEIYYCVFGCTSDAIDFMIRWTAQRFITDDGAGSAITPAPSDFGDPASLMTGVLSNHTTEPTTFSSGEVMLDMTVNTRAPQQWHAHDAQDRIVMEALATTGVAFTPKHATSTANVLVQVNHQE